MQPMAERAGVEHQRLQQFMTYWTPSSRGRPGRACGGAGSSGRCSDSRRRRLWWCITGDFSELAIEGSFNFVDMWVLEMVDVVYPIADYSQYSVAGVPNTWGAVPPVDDLVKAKAAADYLANALGSVFAGGVTADDAPISVKKAFTFAQPMVSEQDARKIFADAVAHSGVEGVPFDLKQFSVKSAFNFTPDKAIYHSANQISQICNLHLLIQSKGESVEVDDSYQDLVDARVITENDLPPLLRYNPAARNLPGFPYGERMALTAFGKVSYWLFWITETIKDGTLLTGSQRRARALVIHKERIPSQYVEEILAPHASQSKYWRKASSDEMRKSLVKAIRIATYISDEKSRKATDYLVATHSASPTQWVVAWFVNSVSGLLQVVEKTLDWALNITIGDAADRYGPTAQDVANLEMLISAAYRVKPSDQRVPDEPFGNK